MKSATAKEYIESLAAQKAAAARLQTAKRAIVSNMQDQIREIINGLIPGDPALAYVHIEDTVDTTFNSARKRPKPETGALFFRIWSNPNWNQYELSDAEVLALNLDHHPKHDQTVAEIIRQIEAKGEWKFVEGSIFRYTDGPDRGIRSQWAMLPV